MFSKVIISTFLLSIFFGMPFVKCDKCGTAVCIPGTSCQLIPGTNNLYGCVQTGGSGGSGGSSGTGNTQQPNCPNGCANGKKFRI